MVLPLAVYFHPKYAAPVEENLSFLVSFGTVDAALTACKESGTASQKFKR
jgi:hypothetical protein